MGNLTNSDKLINKIKDIENPFILVNELPDISNADDKKIYVLGPIDNDINKFEIYTIGNKPTGIFESESTVTSVDLNFNVAQGEDAMIFDGAEAQTGEVYFGVSDYKANDQSLEEPPFLTYGYQEASDETQTVDSTSLMPSMCPESGTPYVSVGNYPSTGITQGAYIGSLKFWYSSSPIHWNPTGGQTVKTWIKSSETNPNSDIYIFNIDDLNEFYLNRIYDLWKQGKYVCIYYYGGIYAPSLGSRVYTPGEGTAIWFYGFGGAYRGYYENFFEGGRIKLHIGANDTITHYTIESGQHGYLSTNEYDCPGIYTPHHDNHPTNKKYVDDRDVYIGSSQPTSNKVEGRLRYDTTNNILKTYDGTNWNEVGGGVTYTAGNGIIIDSNNEISADTTVLATQSHLTYKANAVDVNTKSFYLTGTTGSSNISKAQAAYNWYAAGKTPILVLDSKSYILHSISTSGTSSILRFVSTDTFISTGLSSTTLGLYGYEIDVNDGTVTSISTQADFFSAGLLATNTDYQTPYTPQYDGSPATKKYVDDLVGDVETLLAAI